ncbi:MAG: nitronate monooxygenase [SAR202 cluster bacterium]|nr:nitronate monooxygenase [SAR202 cluster bacterium]
MAITTAFTKAFHLSYPIGLAPMGGVAGGALAAAVSNAGGLGLVGGGHGDREWLAKELAEVTERTQRPWGAGLITWNTNRQTLDFILDYKPSVVMLSFGDPRPYAGAIKKRGVKLICQVQSLEMASLAQEAGADFIVAQGTEAGGHGAHQALFPLLPAVIDAFHPTPVLAAGGIADGRGLAAVLMMGACGALMGTRLYASDEALGHRRIKERIVQATAQDTVRTRIFDTIRGYDWPKPFTGRAIKNRFFEKWQGREGELADNLDAERQAYNRATQDGDPDIRVVFAGEGVDLIKSIEPAGEIVRQVGTEAARLLAGGPHLSQVLPQK